MNLDELLRSPWFYQSPGPLSLLYHGTIILLGARLLSKRVKYRRWTWLNALTDSFFLNGFIVLSGDINWMVACGIRFLPSYPGNLLQVVAVLGRDIVGMVFCYLLVGRYIKDHIISFKKSTLIAYFCLTAFHIVLFATAKSPVQTDWTYAIRQGCSTSTILTSLLVSWVGGKAVTAFLIWTWWKR